MWRLLGAFDPQAPIWQYGTIWRTRICNSLALDYRPRPLVNAYTLAQWRGCATSRVAVVRGVRRHACSEAVESMVGDDLIS